MLATIVINNFTVEQINVPVAFTLPNFYWILKRIDYFLFFPFHIWMFHCDDVIPIIIVIDINF